jgi:hypothetical protein
VGAILEVVGWQEVIVIHDGNQMGCAHTRHIILDVIQAAHFVIDTASRLLEQLWIGWLVEVAFHVAVLYDQSLDPLVTKDRTDAASPSLLVAHSTPAWIVPAKVQAAEARVLCARSSRYGRDCPFGLFILGVHFGHLFAYYVGVHRFLWCFFDSYATIVAININDDVMLGLALDFDSVPACDLAGQRR